MLLNTSFYPFKTFSTNLKHFYHSTHNISSYQQEADFSGGDVPGVASVAGIHRGSQNLTKAHSATSLANGGGHEGRAAERLHQVRLKTTKCPVPNLV